MGSGMEGSNMGSGMGGMGSMGSGDLSQCDMTPGCECQGNLCSGTNPMCMKLSCSQNTGSGMGGMGSMGSGMGGMGSMGSGDFPPCPYGCACYPTPWDPNMGYCYNSDGSLCQGMPIMCTPTMGSGMGNGMGNGMGGGECCPAKKIWGSMNPKMDGMYVNVGKKNMANLPYRCNSPCIYEKKGSWDGMQYCFADSMTSQSECDAMVDDGEEPVDMGSGSGSGSGDLNQCDMTHGCECQGIVCVGT